MSELDVPGKSFYVEMVQAAKGFKMWFVPFFFLRMSPSIAMNDKKQFHDFKFILELKCMSEIKVYSLKDVLPLVKGDC